MCVAGCGSTMIIRIIITQAHLEQRPCNNDHRENALMLIYVNHLKYPPKGSAGQREFVGRELLISP
jgi:hypothetical protein